jgi:hypothetical protein
MFEVTCVFKDVLHLSLQMFCHVNISETEHIEFT